MSLNPSTPQPLSPFFPGQGAQHEAQRAVAGLQKAEDLQKTPKPLNSRALFFFFFFLGGGGGGGVSGVWGVWGVWGDLGVWGFWCLGVRGLGVGALGGLRV